MTNGTNGTGEPVQTKCSHLVDLNFVTRQKFALKDAVFERDHGSEVELGWVCVTDDESQDRNG